MSYFPVQFQLTSTFVYHWATGGVLFPYEFNIGFLIDPLKCRDVGYC